MNEAYVKFDVAKLLKEKGFDWECHHFYYCKNNGKIVEKWMCFIADCNSDRWINQYAEYISAPTQQMACRWFWEEKGLNINAIYGNYPSLKRSFWMPQIDSLDGCYGVEDEDFFREYDSREDCIEAALEYALTNLI